MLVLSEVHSTHVLTVGFSGLSSSLADYEENLLCVIKYLLCSHMLRMSKVENVMHIRLLIVLCFCCLQVGCGGATKPIADGLVVSGEVTWKSKPLKWGTIILTHVSNKAVSASADIVDGKFTVAAERRMKPGNYRVSIYGGSRVEDNPEQAGPAVGNDPNPNVLGPEHNEKSNRTVEIKDGGSSLKFNLN